MVINGNIFSGRSVTIIQNRRAINAGGMEKLKKYDEKRSEEAKNVEKVTIQSTIADVNVYASETSKVEAHFYGEALLDKDIKLDIEHMGNEMLVSLQYSGNCYSGKLNLDITVPYKTFKTVVVKTTSADVTLNKGVSAQNINVHALSGDVTLSEGVSAQYIKVKTSSGDIETDAKFTKADISATSGDIELYIDANNDIDVDISATSGDISAEFNNIGNMNLSTSVMSGDVKNRHRESKSGYTANVDISTTSGDIRIR